MPRRVSRVPRNSAYRLAIEGEISAPNAGGAREILRRTARKIDRCRQWGRDEHRVPRQRALSSAIRGYAACRPPIPPVWRRRHMRPGIHIELSGIQMTYLPAVQLLGSYGPEEDAMIRTLTLALALAAGSAAAFAYSGTEQEQSACRRDVVRHCRMVANENEFAILACLQANRPRLTVACRTVLESHGQ